MLRPYRWFPRRRLGLREDQLQLHRAVVFDADDRHRRGLSDVIIGELNHRGANHDQLAVLHDALDLDLDLVVTPCKVSSPVIVGVTVWTAQQPS